jgi:hypothetical protein
MRPFQTDLESNYWIWTIVDRKDWQVLLYDVAFTWRPMIG